MTIKAINIKNSKYQNSFKKFSISKTLTTTTLMATTALWCCLPASNSFAAEFMFKPSVGIDVGIRSMQFHELYGKDHFASHYNHISPYVQVQILEHLGIQAGFETSDTRKTNKNYSDNEKWLGVDSGGVATRFSSSTKISGEFIGLTMNTNTFWQELIPTKLSLFAGIATLKCKMSHTELAGLADPPDYPITLETMDTGKKVVPKLSVTANFFATKIDGLSFNISYGWEKTSNLKVHKITIVPNVPANRENLLIKLKNSYYATIGINYKL